MLNLINTLLYYLVNKISFLRSKGDRLLNSISITFFIGVGLFHNMIILSDNAIASEISWVTINADFFSCLIIL